MANHSARTKWEKFWEQHSNVDEIYSTWESLTENLCAAADVNGLQILEVGAGTGRDSVRLSEKGARLTVLDYAENAFSKVRQVLENSDTSVNLVRGDGTVLPFEDESFDIVFHQGLLEHFHDPQPLMRENVRVLKKGGLLLIDVPQKYHIYTVIKHILIWMDKWLYPWETEFSWKGLRKLFKDYNLSVEREYGDWLVPSLFYRILRELFRRTGLKKLPMKPEPIPFIGWIRKKLKEFLIKQPFQKYIKHSFITIGIIGKKE